MSIYFRDNNRNRVAPAPASPANVNALFASPTKPTTTTASNLLEVEEERTTQQQQNDTSQVLRPVPPNNTPPKYKHHSHIRNRHSSHGRRQMKQHNLEPANTNIPHDSHPRTNSRMQRNEDDDNADEHHSGGSSPELSPRWQQAEAMLARLRGLSVNEQAHAQQQQQQSQFTPAQSTNKEPEPKPKPKPEAEGVVLGAEDIRAMTNALHYAAQASEAKPTHKRFSRAGRRGETYALETV